MARGPLTFKRRDVERAVEAMRRKGVRKYRIDAERGKVSIFVDEDEAKVDLPQNAEIDEWADADAAL